MRDMKSLYAAQERVKKAGDAAFKSFNRNVAKRQKHAASAKKKSKR